VPYNGADNNDYVDGKGFSERDGSLKSAILKAAISKAGNKSTGLKDNFQQGDSYEQYQYFYHPDHLGSSSFITNTEGEVVQHIEYVPYGEVFIEERNNVWNTPYLFNAKEFDEETGLYYYGARYYDARLAIWYGVDALAENYPNMSPYNYCVGNPVKLIDPDGNEPTEEEAARIAAHVYGDKDDSILIGGWKVSENNDFGIGYINDKCGFKSQLYERNNGDQMEYVYAFAGTEDGIDFKEDIYQAFGQSEQYTLAMDNATKLAQSLGVADNSGNTLTFVGHSLGGGLAAAAAFETGGRALTFNAAGVSIFTKKPYFTGAQIDAFVHFRDELNLMLFPIHLDADGDIHIRTNTACLLGHSIENFYKAGLFQRAGESVSKFNKSIENHFLNAIKQSLCF
jgi:RHS repeat-associated protein